MTPDHSRGIVPATARNHPRVLVIDNEPLVRWSLATGLRLAGFDAVEVSDAAEARVMARLPPAPDVVMLDLQLWDADPRQLVSEIRGFAPDCRFLVLAVEGKDIEAPAWDGVEVIGKPFDLNEVIRVVTAAACRRDGHTT